MTLCSVPVILTKEAEVVLAVNDLAHDEGISKLSSDPSSIPNMIAGLTVAVPDSVECLPLIVCDPVNLLTLLPTTARDPRSSKIPILLSLINSSPAILIALVISLLFWEWLTLFVIAPKI